MEDSITEFLCFEEEEFYFRCIYRLSQMVHSLGYFEIKQML